MKKTNLEKYDYLKKDIFSMSLKGMSYNEIANELEIEPADVSLIIATLRDKDNINYNPELYYAIQMEKSLNKMFVDYDKLNKIMHLIKEGYSFLEISVMMNLEGEDEVKKALSILKRNSKEDYDIVMDIYRRNISDNKFIVFERIRRLENDGVDFEGFNNSKLYNDYLKYKKRKDIIYTFINYDITINDLAKIYKVNIKTIFEYLKDDDNFAKKVMNNLYLKKFYEKSKKIIEEEKNKKNKRRPLEGFKSASATIERIRINVDYYKKIILTFRLSLEEFACLVNVEPSRELYDFILNNSHTLEYWGIKYNFDDNKRGINDFSHYEMAKQFDREYSMTCIMKDEEKKLACLNLLYDYDFKKLISQRKSALKLSREEKNIIFEYRLKYALSYKNLKEISGYYLDGWKVPPEYLEEVKKLNEYNEDISRVHSTLKRALSRKESNNE